MRLLFLTVFFTVFLGLAMSCSSGPDYNPHGHRHFVYSLAIQGSQLASGSLDHTVKLWDLEEEELTATLTGHTGGITDLAYLSQGRLASSSVDGYVRLWKVSTGKNEYILQGNGKGVYTLAWSEKGKTLAVGGQDEILFWNPDTPEKLDRWKVPGAVYSLAYSNDGRYLAVGLGEDTVSIYESKGRKQVGQFTYPTALTLVFSPDGSVLAAGGKGKYITLWNLKEQAVKAKLIGHLSGVQWMAFSPEGSELASAGADGSIRRWNWRWAKPLQVITNNEPKVLAFPRVYPFSSVIYTSDGRRIIAGSYSKSILILDRESGERIGLFVGARAGRGKFKD